jgi:hypothetical protein
LDWACTEQHSRGGKDKFGNIGNLRSSFTTGALAVIRYAKRHDPSHRPWLAALSARAAYQGRGYHTHAPPGEIGMPGLLPREEWVDTRTGSTRSHNGCPRAAPSLKLIRECVRCPGWGFGEWQCPDLARGSGHIRSRDAKGRGEADALRRPGNVGSGIRVRGASVDGNARPPGSGRPAGFSVRPPMRCGHAGHGDLASLGVKHLSQVASSAAAPSARQAASIRSA